MAEEAWLAQGGQEVIGYVYLADTHFWQLGILKVGCAIDPEARMKVLRIPDHYSRPRLVATWRVMDMRYAEFVAHHELAAHRVIGEWFRIGVDEAMEAIRRRLRETHQIPEIERSGADGAWKEAKRLWKDDAVTVAVVSERTGLAPRTLYRRLGPKGTASFTGGPKPAGKGRRK